MFSLLLNFDFCFFSQVIRAVNIQCRMKIIMLDLYNYTVPFDSYTATIIKEKGGLEIKHPRSTIGVSLWLLCQELEL